MYGHYGLEIDGLNFYVDTTYCDRSKVNAYTIPAMTTVYMETIAVDITFPHGARHELGGGIFSQDPCVVIFTKQDSTHLFSISGDTISIGSLWGTNSDTGSATADVGQFTGWQIRAEYQGLNLPTKATVQTFDVTIRPACQYSLIEIDQTGPV